MSVSQRPLRPLVFGPHGWLGAKVVQYFGTGVTTARIHEPQQVRDALEEHNPDLVFLCAGVKGTPNIDWCIENPRNRLITWLANADGPKIVAQECARRRHRPLLVHFSTGCLYDGLAPRLSGRWKETDIPCPVNYYGETKVAGEKFILAADLEHLIIRLRMPISGEYVDGNLIKKLAGYEKVIDVRNSVTVVGDLLWVIEELIKKQRRGIYHVVNEGAVRHTEILQWYHDIVDHNHTYTKRPPEDILKLAVERRSECELDTGRLHEAGIWMPSAETAIRHSLVQYRKALDRARKEK